jgi:hypothetical protein
MYSLLCDGLDLVNFSGMQAMGSCGNWHRIVEANQAVEHLRGNGSLDCCGWSGPPTTQLCSPVTWKLSLHACLATALLGIATKREEEAAAARLLAVFSHVGWPCVTGA